MDALKAQVLLQSLIVFNPRCSVFGLKLASNLPNGAKIPTLTTSTNKEDEIPW